MHHQVVAQEDLTQAIYKRGRILQKLPQLVLSVFRIVGSINKRLKGGISNRLKGRISNRLKGQISSFYATDLKGVFVALQKPAPTADLKVVEFT